MAKKISIVIVSYNVSRLLDECLQSVARALEGVDGEVYVVDNHSVDDTLEMLRQRHPEVHVIANEQNVGFARANNQAIRMSAAEYVLLLNPDTVVYEPTLRGVLDFMDRHPEAGGAGVRMRSRDGQPAPESRRALPTPWVAMLKMLGATKRYYMSHLSWDEPGQIEVISGAFCLLRRKALDQVGLLDEDYFMYGEDIDLSYRLLKGGWQNWYVPYDIIHYKGESTQKSSFRYVHTFYQAMLIFFRKHYGHLSLLFSLPVQMAIYFRASLALLQMMLDRLHRFVNPNKFKRSKL
jgi:GT2 family glycosyltransferase